VRVAVLFDRMPEARADAAEVLTKLDKALRMRRLYEPHHELVQRFDGELRAALKTYFERYGDLRVRVRPTAFELADEAIAAPGLDELALGFFRQGVIALRVAAAIKDDEVSSFLEVCRRGLGAASADAEDFPSLMWRANLPSVKYSAVLGYTEEDGAPGDLGDLNLDADSLGDALADELALDLERAPDAVRKAFQEQLGKLKGGAAVALPDDVRALRDELASDGKAALTRHAFGIVRAVLSVPRRSPDITSSELERVLGAFRSAFLQGGDLDGLVDLATLVKTLTVAPTTSADDKAALGRVIANKLDDKDLHAVVQRSAGGIVSNMDKLNIVIQVLAGNDRGLIARLADLDKDEKARGALNEMLAGAVGHDAEYLINRFRALEGKRAVEMLGLIARKDPVQARMAVAVRLPGATSETQIELLEAIHRIPGFFDARLRAALLRLAAKGGALRIHILQSFTAHRDREVVEWVWQWLSGAELDDLDDKTARAAFAMMLASGQEERVLPLIERILDRKALLARKKLIDLKLALISALTASDASATHALLKRHADSRDKDVARACRDALERMAIERARGQRQGPESKR
jgi:hypothetical protein